MSRIYNPLLILFISAFIHGQDSYAGPITFDYTGVNEGTFESTLFDTVLSGGALTASNSDSIWILVSAVDQTAPDTFDLFLAFMQDTTSHVHPRSWSISQTDPENIEFLMVFIPEIDSSFINQFSNLIPDSTASPDSASIDSMITFVLQELMDDVFVSISGSLEIETASDSAFSGIFSGTFLKGEVTWPLPQINITNGMFSVNKFASTALSVSEKHLLQPEAFTMDYPYPNPFNPSTTLRFNLPKREYVTLNIYNISGNLVESLLQKSLGLGQHTIQWNAKNYSSGIYFAVLQSTTYSITQKLFLIK